jgi:hypothetical protein
LPASNWLLASGVKWPYTGKYLPAKHQQWQGAGANQDGDQFGIGEGSRSFQGQLFAGPVFGRPAFNGEGFGLIDFHSTKSTEPMGCLF